MIYPDEECFSSVASMLEKEVSCHILLPATPMSHVFGVGKGDLKEKKKNCEIVQITL